MWIAFIFQYLWDTKQPKLELVVLALCCELLSFFSIFGIQNNYKDKQRDAVIVVNCFHFSVSLGYKTTIFLIFIFDIWLWIAFIFQYLWDTKQHTVIQLGCIMSCELLSFFSIFGIQNNNSFFFKTWVEVVNCFHFSVSLGYKTTLRFFLLLLTQLWIAFIFQYLWDTKQRWHFYQ